MKLLSNLERVKTKNPISKNSYNTSYSVRSLEEYTENGRLLKRTCVNVCDNAENMSKYKVSDFALENLIAVGAIDNLRTMQLNHNTMENQDLIDNAILDMQIYEDYQNLNNNN